MARTLKGTDPKAAKPSKPKILVFGKPGVGKTWTALDFPNVYYIDTEGGANLDHYTDKLKKSGGQYFGPEQGSLDFGTVIDEIITLATVPHQFKTLVLDSYSKLFNTCIDATAERLKNEGRKIEFSVEKKEAIAHSRRLVRWLDKLDMNAILICHEKDKWQGGEVTGQTFDGWDKLEYELHLLLQIKKQGASRKASVHKTRLLTFPDALTFDWSYAKFAELYGQDVIESAVVPMVPATADQVNRLTTLIDILKVDPDVVIKWKEKAEVASFVEMDTATIQKCIDFLTAKLPQAATAAA